MCVLEMLTQESAHDAHTGYNRFVDVGLYDCFHLRLPAYTHDTGKM